MTRFRTPEVHAMWPRSGRGTVLIDGRSSTRSGRETLGRQDFPKAGVQMSARLYGTSASAGAFPKATKSRNWAWL
jgi:hypothetical protein